MIRASKGSGFRARRILLGVLAIFSALTLPVAADPIGTEPGDVFINSGVTKELVPSSDVTGSVFVLGGTLDVYGGTVSGPLGVSVSVGSTVTIYGDGFALDTSSGSAVIVEEGGVPVAIDPTGWTGDVTWTDVNDVEWTMLFSSDTEIALEVIGGGGVTDPPVIDSVAVDVTDPVVEGTEVTLTTTFTGQADQAVITWGDGDSTTVSGPMSPFDASHVYSGAGVYTVSVTLSNEAGDSEPASYEYVVVYDPTSGALVTGLGWIPEDDVDCGKAYFGFLCTQWGTGHPFGWVRVRWGENRFRATELDWVTADDAGETAWFAGVGRINGAGEYFFMVEITDDPDSIWITIFGEYDTEGLTALGNGAIRIRAYDWN